MPRVAKGHGLRREAAVLLPHLDLLEAQGLGATVHGELDLAGVTEDGAAPVAGSRISGLQRQVEESEGARRVDGNNPKVRRTGRPADRRAVAFDGDLRADDR